MESNHTAAVLQHNLTLLRRNAGLTQEQFAEKLGLSFQAVSKWENGLSCPDISLLPEIAAIYGVEIGQLFRPIDPESLHDAAPSSAQGPEPPKGTACGAEKSPDDSLDGAIDGLMRHVSRRLSQAFPLPKRMEFDFHWDNDPPPSFETALPVQVEGLPWEDDGVYRAVLFCGRSLVTPPVAEKGVLAVEDGLDAGLLSAFSVTCGDIAGDIRCVLGSLTCGEVEGDVLSCASVTADSIEGNVQQCANVRCDEINGSVVQCQSVHCDEINIEG